MGGRQRTSLFTTEEKKVQKQPTRQQQQKGRGKGSKGRR
jgi:hypothetical protein